MLSILVIRTPLALCYKVGVKKSHASVWPLELG